MLRLLLVTMFFSMTSAIAATAQLFPVDTIAKTGKTGQRINLVFLGDGYTSGQLGQYSTDAINFVNGIFAQTPFKEYKNYFNAFAIRVPSNASGANHPQNTTDSDCTSVPKGTADNYFGSTFDTNGIHRLLAPGNYAKVFSVLTANLPEYDQAFIIVNTSYYGGSGGAFATASTNVAANEVAIHEIGHSFASLADEYWAGPGYAAEAPNMTREAASTKIKWKKWLDLDGVGIYPHSEDPSWYRPHQNCKMRFLNVSFCDVCREEFVERFHDLINPVDSYLPLASKFEMGTAPANFSIVTVDPIPNTLQVTWTKNGVVVAKNTSVVSIPAEEFVEGINSVKAIVDDTTTLSQSATHSIRHVHVVEWKATINAVTGIELTPEEAHYKLSVFPNPVTDAVKISYSLSVSGDVRIVLLDANGRKIKTMARERQAAGTYDFSFTSADLNMNGSGVYLLALTVNGTVITERILRN